MEPWLWALGIGIGIAGSLVGVIYWQGQNRDDKQDARFEKDEKALADHIREDVSAHERLRAVETKVDNLEREVTSLRERWHDLRTEISQTLSSWYLSIIKLIGKDDR